LYRSALHRSYVAPFSRRGAFDCVSVIDVPKVFMMGKSRNLWKLAVAWAAVIFVLSSIPGRAIPAVAIVNFDKIAHTGVYFVFGALCFLALPKSPSRTASTYVLWAGALATLYGVSDEIHQLFVPGRSSEVLDVVADCVGGFLGALAASALPSLKSNEAS
jgi:VanZ family protein